MCVLLSARQTAEQGSYLNIRQETHNTSCEWQTINVKSVEYVSSDYVDLKFTGTDPRHVLF